MILHGYDSYQWDYHVTTPTASAFGQARAKLKPKAFKEIFDTFNQTIENTKTFHGHQLLAHDGSDLNLPLDMNDKGTYFQPGNSDGFKLLHMKALYDVLKKQYLNVDFQKNVILMNVPVYVRWLSQ